MSKIIIAGGRDFNNYKLLSNSCYEHILYRDVEIVSGTARGADKLGEKFAKEYGLKLTKFPANWNKYGKSAGYLRNKQMAEYADELIAFWNGKSKGTKHMINLAKSLNLKVIIIEYNV